ncbi:hypothetical protein MJA45_28170 [Paenibacillus aurantius]|uniref:Uncharacterized protein n=1 Tax=Paenibacillus aurantius TaxID=2918900 RepID=A0AA96RHS3_9BACL|nr:hypothetical protein [Paenibacillus aurantius]WNQ11429.1 hypothetical protein MJA45_28170 [Paenibacillus aurantius]
MKRQRKTVLIKAGGAKKRTGVKATLETFTVSGDVGGSHSFVINPGFRNTQDIFVPVPGGQSLHLDLARFFLRSSNLRLRIRVSDAENPTKPSFRPRQITSPTRAGQFGNRVLLVNNFSDFAEVRLTVSVVAVARATVRPSDGWSLLFSIRKP